MCGECCFLLVPSSHAIPGNIQENLGTTQLANHIPVFYSYAYIAFKIMVSQESNDGIQVSKRNISPLSMAALQTFMLFYCTSPEFSAAYYPLYVMIEY